MEGKNVLVWFAAGAGVLFIYAGIKGRGPTQILKDFENKNGGSGTIVLDSVPVTDTVLMAAPIQDVTDGYATSNGLVIE